MARKAILRSAGGEFLVYLNETAVGKGRGNKRLADVQLVQRFLLSWLTDTGLIITIPTFANWLAGGSPIGKCDRQTIMAIELFQKSQQELLVVDGVVSVPRGASWDNKHIWTMLSINAWYYYHFLMLKQEGIPKHDWENLEDDSFIQERCPELYSDLKSSSVGQI